MPKLPQVKPRQVEKVLLKLGFVSIPTEGGHVVFKHADGRRTVVSGHNRPVNKGTLRAILRQAELSLGDFLRLLR